MLRLSTHLFRVCLYRNVSSVRRPTDARVAVINVIGGKGEQAWACKRRDKDDERDGVRRLIEREIGKAEAARRSYGRRNPAFQRNDAVEFDL
jgi:hypothetical protein